MGMWAEHVVPHLVEATLGSKPVGRLRKPALAGLEGEVVEIGFGSGLNLEHYPPTVMKVHAVEPSEVARQLAAPRVAASKIAVDYSGLDGQVASVRRCVGGRGGLDVHACARFRRSTWRSAR